MKRVGYATVTVTLWMLEINLEKSFDWPDFFVSRSKVTDYCGMCFVCESGSGVGCGEGKVMLV